MIVQRLCQRHVGDWFHRPGPEYQSLAAFRLFKSFFKDLDSSRSQRHAMSHLGLHPWCRHRPDSLREVDLLPFHMPQFAGAAGRQDDEFQHMARDVGLALMQDIIEDGRQRFPG